MVEFIIIKNILKRTNEIFWSLFLFKLFLIFLYIVGGYQSFMIITMKIILRFILTNDILLFVFAILNIATNNIIERKKHERVLIICFSIFNILFSIITFFMSLFLIVII